MNNKTKPIKHTRILLANRKAHFDYHLLEKIEAGIVLTGPEVKSLRLGKGDLSHAFAYTSKEEIALHQLYIEPYTYAHEATHEEATRERRLLLHKRQIKKLSGAVNTQGLTLVPTKIYLSAQGTIKVEIALSKGKTKVDKRETLKEKSWQRHKQQLMKRTACA